MSGKLYDSDIFNPICLKVFIRKTVPNIDGKTTKGIVESKKRGAHKAVFVANNDSVGSIKPQKSTRGRNADKLPDTKVAG